MTQPPIRGSADVPPRRDGWQRFQELACKAKQDAAPVVDVVEPVLARIQKRRFQEPMAQSRLGQQERTVLWAAGVSTALAAGLVLAVWTAAQTLHDPSAGEFRPFQVAFVERP